MIIPNDMDIDHINNNFHREYNIQNYKYIIHYSASSSIFGFELFDKFAFLYFFISLGRLCKLLAQPILHSLPCEF